MKFVRLFVTLLAFAVLGLVGFAFHKHRAQEPLPDWLARVIPNPPPPPPIVQSPVNPPPGPQPTVTQAPVPQVNPSETNAQLSSALANATTESGFKPEVLLKGLEGGEGFALYFTRAVKCISEGNSPTMLRPLLPPGGFYVTPAKGGWSVIHKKTFERYDSLTRLLTAIDANEAMSMWQTFKPVLDTAFKESGRDNERLEQTLLKAIDHLLVVPVPNRIEVLKEPEPGKRSVYTFADPMLEKLTPAQKQLLRMGPDNARAIQAKLREWKVVLEPLATGP